MPKLLNMPKLRFWQSSESGRVLNMRAFHSVSNVPEYSLLDRILNVS